MPQYKAPLRDMRFQLNEVFDYAGHYAGLSNGGEATPDMVDAILEGCATFCEEVLAPLYATGDSEGCTIADGVVTTPKGYKEAYAEYVAGGWQGLSHPQEYGGQGLPMSLNLLKSEMMGTANWPFTMYPGLSLGCMNTVFQFGSEAQKNLYMPPLVSGEWTGTMCLTEPQCGTDLAQIRTKAEPQPDGTYKLYGTKIYISFGEHDMVDNIVHLVLARTPDAPAGTKGISCFIVPKFLVNDDGSLGARNDVTCVSIEHKMGIKASPTCVMSYGENDGAIGYLIGEENRGMRYMFTMMNNARLSVGLEGLALAERSYQDALQYSQERRQGRAPGETSSEMSLIVDLPDVRRMLLTMKALIDALRSIVYVNAQALDLAAHHPDADVRERNQELAELLIPVSKGFGTDMGIECTSIAIQVFGGMGYIEESGVPQHFRDARITSIYEGTNGIQAMDLVGRKLPMRGGGVMSDFLDGVAALDGELANAGPQFAVIRTQLNAALGVVHDTVGWLTENGVADVRNALAGATPFLRMFGLLVGARYLAQGALSAQAALATSPDDADYLEARIVVARFYCENLLPAVAGLAPAVTAGYGDLYAIDPETMAG